MKEGTFFTAGSIVLGTCLTFLQANAQEDTGRGVAAAPVIEEIVVTAQKRGENLQDVPIAITAISADSLQAKGITTVLELTKSTPYIYAAPFTINNSTLFFFMRGMGVGNPGQITADPAIGVYENGVYNPRPVPYVFDLLDPERVEILRGPQGTLYGRNTTGGAINVISRAPTGEFGLRQLVSYASRDQYRSVTNIDLPAVGDFMIKGTFAFAGGDGFAKNVDDPSVPETNDFGISRHDASRLAARWQPMSDFSADYSFTVGREKSTGGLVQSRSLDGREIFPGIPYRFIRDRAYRPVFLPFSHTRHRDHGLTLEWAPTDTLTLRSITGIRHWQTDQYQDLMEAYLTPITVEFRRHSDVLTQEIQAVGTAWADRIKYAAGLFYFREDVTSDDDTTFIFGVQSRLTDLDTVSKAAYGQITITPPVLDDRLDLTIGGRYTTDRKEGTHDSFFGGSPTQVDSRGVEESSRFNPSFTVAYRWTDTTNSYAKVSTGYRAGGFDEAGPVFNATFSPEDLTSFEIGVKTDLLGSRLRANFAAFYNDYEKVQLPLAVDPNNPSINAVRNAGEASIRGAEVELSAALTSDLTVNINYAYLDTDIDKVQLISGGPNIADQFIIPYAPEHSVNISGDFVVLRTEQGPLTLHADYNYTSSAFGSSGAGPAVPGHENYRTPGYETTNVRLSLGRIWFEKPAQISVFVENAFNSRHKSWVSANGSQATSFFDPNFFLAEPRTVGVELSFEM